MKYWLVIILILNTGCASVIYRGTSESPSNVHPYIGVRGDGYFIVSGLTGKAFRDSDSNNIIGPIGESLALTVIGAVDMPLSFCMDTILLPRDIYMMTTNDKKLKSNQLEPMVNSLSDPAEAQAIQAHP